MQSKQPGSKCLSMSRVFGVPAAQEAARKAEATAHAVSAAAAEEQASA